MFTILICSLVLYTNALEAEERGAEAEIKDILAKYVEKIPDIESKYVVNEGLSRSISKYFNGKMSALPLFKISLKIDRTPVKIPWTLGSPRSQVPVAANKRPESEKFTYKLVRPGSIIPNVPNKVNLS